MIRYRIRRERPESPAHQEADATIELGTSTRRMVYLGSAISLAGSALILYAMARADVRPHVLLLLAVYCTVIHRFLFRWGQNLDSRGLDWVRDSAGLDGSSSVNVEMHIFSPLWFPAVFLTPLAVGGFAWHEARIDSPALWGGFLLGVIVVTLFETRLQCKHGKSLISYSSKPAAEAFPIWGGRAFLPVEGGLLYLPMLALLTVWCAADAWASLWWFGFLAILLALFLPGMLYDRVVTRKAAKEEGLSVSFMKPGEGTSGAGSPKESAP